MAKRKGDLGTEKPTKKPTKTAPSTQYALCVPSSIISLANARNLEQITHIAYQIAKTATLYNVAEVVVLDIPSPDVKQVQLEKEAGKMVLLGSDIGGKKIKFNFSDNDIVNAEQKPEEAAAGPEGVNDESQNAYNSLLFASLLQFFITPPYLVKTTFAESRFNKKFKYARALPKLSSLPFMSNNNVLQDFREGLTVPKKTPKITKKNKKVSALKKLSVTKYVCVGEEEPLELAQDVPVNVRVTVDVKNKKIVSPLQAYGVAGNKSSFGYLVRFAKSFSSIFTESSFPDGYTSSIYVDGDNYFGSGSETSLLPAAGAPEKGGRVLLVVGNMKDLDYSFGQDKASLEGVDSAQSMFDAKMEVPAGARIEDAALIALAKAN